jgi:hypothetical protein
MSSQLFRRRDDFLPNIMAADESRFHHFAPSTELQSMEWHNAPCPQKEEAKCMLCRQFAGMSRGTCRLISR